MIYLDCAATSLHKPDTVANAVVRAMGMMGNSGRGTHEAALSGSRIIYETRELLDELFHGYGAEQTVFTMNATESLNIAIKGILEPGDRVVTSVMEHNSVLRPLYEMEKRGVFVERIGCIGMQEDSNERKKGKLDEERLLDSITEDVKAVILTHESNLTGNLTDIRKIGRTCREKGVLFVVDASQTAGVFPIDMQRDCIDILCFTGHKSLLGPQGTGGLCVRSGIKIKPLLSGGSGIETYLQSHPDKMPTALEAGTLNGHGIAGLCASLLFLKKQGVDVLRKRELQLADHFYHRVKDLSGVTIYGDMEECPMSEEKHGAIVSLNIRDMDSGEVSDWLAQEYGILTRSGGHCAPLMHKALGTEEQGCVRFSFSHFNTIEEVEKAAEAVREIAEG